MVSTTRLPPEPVNWIERLKRSKALADRHRFEIKFLIATVPDPIDSHVGWQFDPILDGIQKGFEQKKFAVDRYYYPWQHYAVPPPTEPLNIDLPAYSRFPGVILFRSSSLVRPARPPGEPKHNIDAARPELYVVFLIGETPTRGIHKAALAAALDFIVAWHQIDRKDGGACARPFDVRVLGPTYSGSSMSLRIGITDWAANAAPVARGDIHLNWAHFRVVSGTAQDTRNKPTLQFKFSAHREAPKAAENRRVDRVTSEFTGTMVPTSALTECMGKFLDARGVDRKQVAFLVEGNTAYGEQASFAPETRRGHYLIVRYPMQIGRVRTAYQKEHALLLQPVKPQRSAPHSHIELSLPETRTADDLPPAMSPFAANSMEELMVDTLETLARRDVRYLGVIGTDPMDVLFISRLARRACPDVQIFTTLNDLLYTHPDYRRIMDGMLIFTAYPLFMKSQAWARKPEDSSPTERRQFSNSWSEAFYNATLFVLSDKHGHVEALDYSPPFECGALERAKPPVWCVTVSNGAVWPVDCYVWTHDVEVTDELDPEDRTYSDGLKAMLVKEQLSGMDSEKRKLRKAEAQANVQRYLTYYDYHKTPDADAGDGYIRPLSRPERKDCRNAHHAELMLGLDGLLGFLSLLLNSFAIINCSQYAVSRWPCYGANGLARWALFYVDGGSASRDHRQANIYNCQFFAALWLAQVVAQSPLLAWGWFGISWHALHPRHRLIFSVNIFSILFTLMILVHIAFVIFSNRRGVLNNARRKFERGCLRLRVNGEAGTLLLAAASIASAVSSVAICWSTQSLVALVLIAVVAMVTTSLVIAAAMLSRIDVFMAIPALITFAFLARWLFELATWIAVVMLVVAVIAGFGVVSKFRKGSSWAHVTAAMTKLPRWQRVKYLLGTAAVLLIATVVVGAAALRLVGRSIQQGTSADACRLAMFTERAGNVSSGISPIPPALCILAGIWMASVCQIRRLRLLREMPLVSPFPSTPASSLELAGIDRRVGELCRLLHVPAVLWYGWFPVVLVALIASLLVFASPRETFESEPFKWFVRAGLIALLVMIACTLVQIVALWQCLHKLLQRLAWHPIANSYTRLPGVVRREVRAQLFSRKPRAAELEIALQYAQSLSWEAFNPKIPLVVRDLTLKLSHGSASDSFAKLLDGDTALAEQRWSINAALAPGGDRHKSLLRFLKRFSRSLAGLLARWWETRPERHSGAVGEEKQPPSTGSNVLATPYDRWREKAEEFIAIQVAIFLRSVFLHLRNYLQTALALMFLLLAMLNSYPFQPHRMLLLFAWTAGLFVIIAALFVFIGVNRDEVVSNLSGQHPHRLDWDRNLVLALFTYGILPLLVLLSMQFPEFGEYMYSFSPLEPLSKALK